MEMQNIRFLAVDDSPTMRRIIVNTLKRIGFNNISEASNGKEALAKIYSEKVDFVITDWNMPEMNGLELIKAIKTDDSLKNLPILMVTTRGVKDDIVEAMKAGVSSYIVKPFSPQTLKEKIEQILKS
ncbi:MAG: response regulator [candidate division KSB1 bacterium]|nr:response regulator [candidate division KSB1 bacterium]MDQ7065938.1 response regulator [candidate division KSB1 bacterium]